MARRPHLPLRRLEGELVRRKSSGFPPPPIRDHAVHGARLVTELADIVQRNAERTDTAKEAAIILKINTEGYVNEELLAGANLQILAQRDDTATVVLSMDPNLTSLRDRSALYSGPIPTTQKDAPHSNLFKAIEGFAELVPADRIGSALMRRGIAGPEDVPDDEIFLLDVELWDVNDQGLRELYVERVRKKAIDFGGDLLSRYRGAGLFIVRVRVTGAGLKDLLTMKEVAWIDLPPVPDFAPDSSADMTVEELPPLDPPPDGSVCIGIIDSGITAAHPMLHGVVSGAFGVPERFGSDDGKRHGTAVAALASYGSVADQITRPRLAPRFRIASAKVVDAAGRFDDERTVADIIEEAIRRLHGEYGCRVINISLADIEHLVGDRPSNWAMVLDNLIRELGIVVTVSAGNVSDISQRLSDEGVAIYPQYLLGDDNRLYEPASSVSSLVVGSLAHSNGLTDGNEEEADIVALTARHHPSPFSRSGPGFADGIKPDLADYGGTAVWLGYAETLSADRPSCGVLTLNPNYLQSLMRYRHGTSFAAPVVAYKAAVLVEEYPERSANFVRALIGLSADHPPELIDGTGGKDSRDRYRHAGYGVCDPDLALASDDGRVVMAIEDSLPIDRFAVYEVPIPTDFQTVKGRRHIKVSLAFDPPTRNSRKEYLGIKMGYHMVRGKSAKEVFDRFRKWEKEEKETNGGAAVFEGTSWKCKMEPLATIQEAGTLQVGTYSSQRNISEYGDRYYLVVRCEGKWAAALVTEQTFAVAVELWHEVPLELYQQVAVVVQA
ncbi:S8 family peptidase [Mesorhizobium sp. Root172]|uniref:S8 family peptidase n=1 Tax=Mesorhizobium sp. Root172 TaxID=1736481 RepID=UPI000A6DC066|nr:S8 family peptidase [Mesorhizobium sp. Root172]